MKKQIALILALILSLSAWAWVLAEEGEEPFCWSDPGKYLINSLEPVKEIHNEEEAEAYAKELWSVFSSEPYPEGTGDMNVDKADGSYVPSSSAIAHYVTATGCDGDWLRISSWGSEYYIKRSEYDDYVRRHSASLVSNILMLRKTH